jgi:siroheme synthase-like protein
MYPLFLQLDQRPCLVVGGGPIGAQKARGLVEAGARVTVISPGALHADWEPLRTGADVQHLDRCFEAGDCRGMVLVISATADPETDARVVACARAHNALVNTVDVVPLCDWFAGSVVRRGPVQVVIGTGGRSPSLAVALRRWLDALLPAELGPFAEAMGEGRAELLARWPAFEPRARHWNAAVGHAFVRLREADTQAPADWAAWMQRVHGCTRGGCTPDHPCCALLPSTHHAGPDTEIHP